MQTKTTNNQIKITGNPEYFRCSSIDDEAGRLQRRVRAQGHDVEVGEEDRRASVAERIRVHRPHLALPAGGPALQRPPLLSCCAAAGSRGIELNGWPFLVMRRPAFSSL